MTGPRDIFYVRFLEKPDVVKSPKAVNVDFRLGMVVGTGIGLLSAIFLSILALLVRNV